MLHHCSHLPKTRFRIRKEKKPPDKSTCHFTIGNFQVKDKVQCARYYQDGQVLLHVICDCCDCASAIYIILRTLVMIIYSRKDEYPELQTQNPIYTKYPLLLDGQSKKTHVETSMVSKSQPHKTCKHSLTLYISPMSANCSKVQTYTGQVLDTIRQAYILL